MSQNGNNMKGDRKNIIPFPKDKQNQNGGSGKGGSVFLDSKVKTIIIISGSLLILAAIIVITVLLIKNSGEGTKSDPEVFNPGYSVLYEKTGLCMLGDNVIICTNTNVTAIGTDGIRKWDMETTLSEPDITLCGDYAVVTEKNKNTMMIFDDGGFVKRETLPGKFLSSYSNGKNLTVTFETENDTYGVAMYDFSGNDPLVFVRKYETALVFASAISEKGDFIVASGLDSHANSATGVLSFIRTTDGEVYATEQYEGEFFPAVLPVGNKVIAANTDLLVTMQKKPSVSDSEDSKTVLWKRESEDLYVVCGETSGSFAATVKTNINSEKKYSLLTVYGSNGTETGECTVNEKISGMKICGNILIYADNYLGLYNSKCECIGEYTGLADIETAVVDGRKAAVIADGTVYIIYF